MVALYQVIAIYHFGRRGVCLYGGGYVEQERKTKNWKLKMLEQVVFYIFGAVLVTSAGMVVTVRNPVHAALFLVLAFFCSAAIWLLLQAEFLAIVLVLVYVGAVMVLFLFVVMMLNINLAPLREGFAGFLPVGLFVAALMLTAMGLIVSSDRVLPGLPPAAVQPPVDAANTELLGKTLFTEYLYPFEIAGAILLVAIIAAISLTMRKPAAQRTPKPEKQVVVKRDTRVRLVNMESASHPEKGDSGSLGRKSQGGKQGDNSD